MLSTVGPIAALQHIATFSAGLRGHEVLNWDASEGYALATCIRCRAQVRVYFSPLQPELSGAALKCQCSETEAKRVA